MSTTRSLHRPSSAVAAPSAICVMDADPAAVPILRAFARQTVGRWGRAECAVESLALIVTELVTNACLHSGSSQVTLCLFRDEGQVGVHVLDQGRWRDAHHAVLDEDADLHGRGLRLVRAYADTMEIRRTEAGTHVVATLLTGAPQAQPDCA
ncbi:ATP-binding protein [Streptomyces bobili]|uniref:ATP-binding protein n=1 Tax=Streptomyces bobili TaxID=67280 RepID=UPI003416BC6C